MCIKCLVLSPNNRSFRSYGKVKVLKQQRVILKCIFDGDSENSLGGNANDVRLFELSNKYLGDLILEIILLSPKVLLMMSGEKCQD